MTRFALIATLAALPFAVVAAPVPEHAPKPFGTDGIVARAELEALTFDSRAVPEKERTRDRVKRLVEIQKRVQIADKDGGPPKVRPANRYDVGVHMPATRFKVGEPVVAYFVVRNNRDEELELDGRLDFVNGAPAVCNDCELRVFDARTGKPPAQEERLRAIKCGGRELMIVPSDGFYCVKGDLGPLPVGEYSVDWRCGEFRSAPVRFRVFDRDGPAPPAARAARTTYLFFHLDDDYERDHEDFEVPVGGPMRRFVAPEEFPVEEMAAALACGGEDAFAFVPDVRAIPSRDKNIVVSVDWHPYRSGDRIAVTLRAAPPFETVRFAEPPQLYLQVERPEGSEPLRAMREKSAKKKLDRIENFTTPFTIEAHLPESWREVLGSGEIARVAVVVTARELPNHYYGLNKARDVRANREHPECPTWRGVVRSDFAELRLPPPAP